MKSFEPITIGPVPEDWHTPETFHKGAELTQRAIAIEDHWNNDFCARLAAAKKNNSRIDLNSTVDALRELKMRILEDLINLRTEIKDFLTNAVGPERRKYYSQNCEALECTRAGVKKSLLKIGFNDPDSGEVFGTYPNDTIVRHPKFRKHEMLVGELNESISALHATIRSNDVALQRLYDFAEEFKAKTLAGI